MWPHWSLGRTRSEPQSLCLIPLGELMHWPRWTDSKMMRQIMMNQINLWQFPFLLQRLNLAAMDSFLWIMSLFQTMAQAPKAPLTPLFVLFFLRVPPPPPRRVLIPQRGRVSEPERDGDGGGLLMWRSAAAIATWGLLSFNQTKTWWRMCTARGNCRGLGGGAGTGGQERSGATGRAAQGGST